ncbi:hypothetical protein XA68_17413 [Ophiocordyceps unilateralis]|uniref:FMN-dependent dehydrogenase domain-containing protein n=1 Tax=Ophiocordyceps unilateralis TaxID=268505 RepID=A0A2A9PKK6_OPHUN|nr:hypothetical protein XA68_17413 [Ophiocordyceps unilateralis]
MARATLLLITLFSSSLSWAQSDIQNATTAFERSFIVDRPVTVGQLKPKDKAMPYGFYLKELIGKGIKDGQPPVVTTNPNLLEETARKTMTERGFNYIRGSAGEGATRDANRLAFRQWKIVPRVLRPTTPRNLSVTLFGRTYGQFISTTRRGNKMKAI